MAFFDATLFTVAPRLYRALDEALDPESGRALAPASDSGRSGTRPPLVKAFLHWGSWIGGDRDGNPGVTAEITEKTLRIQADHVLRGYEAVATRLMQTIAAATSADRVARPLASRLARDAEDLPETDRQLRRRFPDEPYRQRFGFIAERLRRTRAALTGEPAPLTGRYGGPADLDAELVEIQEALVADGLGRVAWGEVAELRWQLGTFGFHLASLEIRQHSTVHAAALAAIRAGQPASTEVAPGVSLGEVLATFRAIAAAQARHGIEACRRYVVSFTASAADVTDVLELARLATADEGGTGPRRPSTSCRCSSRATRSRTPGRSWPRCSTTRPIASGSGSRRPPGGDARLLRIPTRSWASWPGPGCSSRPRPRWSRWPARGASS